MWPWLDPLENSIKRDGTAVIVSIIAVDGSVPREVGATMVVSEGGVTGTIGGGNLEYTAIKKAVDLLSGSADLPASKRQTCRVSLGPSLGQCCGGRVELLYEYVTRNTGWFEQLTAGHGFRVDERFCRCLDKPLAVVLSAAEFQTRFMIPSDDSEAGFSTAMIFNSDDGARWFCEMLREELPNVWIYGAGHVGQAVVSQLSLLPCNITLLDHREEWLDLQPDAVATQLLSHSLEDDAVDAPTDATHVVMTHSHAIDFDICHAILKRGEFDWLGLIGSNTKRQTFVSRLGQRGIGDEITQRLRCPIGNLQLDSCLPSVIALNLAAELASRWQQTGKLR